MECYSYRTYRLHSMILVALLIPDSHGACVEKLDAAAVINDIVSFYICETPNAGFDTATVYDGSGTDGPENIITEQTWKDGWYWEKGTDFFYISHEVDAVNAVYTIGYATAAGSVKTTEVNVWGQAAPQLCASETGGPYIVTADFGANANSTVCILSLDESGTFGTSAERVSDNIDPGSTSTSTFTVSDQPGNGSYFERELILNVTGMSVADVGNWTVDVNNGVGTFAVDVTIQATGPSMMCQGASDAGGVYAQVGDPFSFTHPVCVLIPGGQSPTVDLTKFNDTGQNYSLVVGASSDNGISYYITSRSVKIVEEDFGLWFVEVVTVDDGTDYTLSFTLLQGEAPTTTTETDDTASVNEGDDDDDGILYIIIGCVVGGLLIILIAVTIYSKKKRYLCFRKKEADCDAPLHTGKVNEAAPQNGTATEKKASKKSKSPSKKSRKGDDNVELGSPNARDSEEIVIHNDIYGQTPGQVHVYPKEEETVIQNDVYGFVPDQGQTQGYQPKEDKLVIQNDVYGRGAKPAAAEYASVNKQRGPPPQPGRLPPINAPNKGKVSTPNTDNEDRDSGSASASSLTVAETGSGKSGDQPSPRSKASNRRGRATSITTIGVEMSDTGGGGQASRPAKPVG